jgi:hypothetical protein
MKEFFQTLFQSVGLSVCILLAIGLVLYITHKIRMAVRSYKILKLRVDELSREIGKMWDEMSKIHFDRKNKK